jgi:hypothetical protein
MALSKTEQPDLYDPRFESWRAHDPPRFHSVMVTRAGNSSSLVWSIGGSAGTRVEYCPPKAGVIAFTVMTRTVNILISNMRRRLKCPQVAPNREIDLHVILWL